MCGIAGFIDFKKRSSVEILKRMTSMLAHRGPDGEGYFFDETGFAQIGLGHRRLSIIDLTNAGAQPMEFDGLQIIFNGEIYNYQEIKATLEKKGHSFHSHSDTEVILHAFREWGIKAVNLFKGMFVFVIYDAKNQTVTCLRDRAGVKPFYYYWNEGQFFFGSELKAIMAHPQFPKKISTNAVASFLQYGYVSHPYAIFENTFKLPPAHSLVLDLKNEQTETTEYWNVYDYYNKPKVQISLSDAVEETETILQKAFQYRMVADVPVGVFLSGGFDSTSVVALLQKESTEKIKTFTIGSADSKHNEAPFAKKIAEVLGTDHTEYYCTAKEALEIIPELPYYYDEPFADSSAIPTILVSRLARKKVTVALSADAGDEVFAGYSRYEYLLKYLKRSKAVPFPVRRAMAGVMDKISSGDIPYFKSKYHFHSRYQKLKNVLKEPSDANVMKSMLEVFSPADLQTIMKPSFSELRTKHVSTELSKYNFDSLSYMQAIDYQTYLTDDILQKVDRATMSVSLEGREPFLDQEIIQWAAQLPSNYKYHNGSKKYLLKEIVYKYVPKDLMDRPKMGFSIPIDKWMYVELKELVMELLDEKNLQHGLFDEKEVNNLKESFFSNRPDLHIRIWHLLMFQMWYKKWM